MVIEGYWYGLPLLLLSAGSAWLRLYWVAAIFLVLLMFVLNFFRNPDREVPDNPLAIVSPADGRVLQIENESWEGQQARRVCIFMSPIDVHVNRSPIAGVIGEVRYRKGSFKAAFSPQALENEQNIFVVEGDPGHVAVTQIAGVLARRIVFWKRRGDRVERGERVGMIKFGSRVDVVCGLEVQLEVKIGDRVRAGSSIIGISRTRSGSTA